MALLRFEYLLVQYHYLLPLHLLLMLVARLERSLHPVFLVILDTILFIVFIVITSSNGLSLNQTSSLHFLDFTGQTPKVPLQSLSLQGDLPFRHGLFIDEVPVPVLERAWVRLVNMRNFLELPTSCSVNTEVLLHYDE